MSASTTVRGLDGETFELRHAPGAGLAELKRLIAQQTGIDPSQQNISRGGRAVIDTEEEEEEEEDETAKLFVGALWWAGGESWV